MIDFRWASTLDLSFGSQFISMSIKNQLHSERWAVSSFIRNDNKENTVPTTSLCNNGEENPSAGRTVYVFFPFFCRSSCFYHQLWLQECESPTFSSIKAQMATLNEIVTSNNTNMDHFWELQNQYFAAVTPRVSKLPLSYTPQSRYDVINFKLQHLS